MVSASAAFAQTTASNIDQMTGWSNCGSCAGPGGQGANTPRALTQHLSSPSMDGKSAKFSIAPKSKYAAALWWKQLGAHSNATHFVYDLYFYLTNPSVSQSLEFDANQSVGGHKYIFGTQCNIKGSKQWDIWAAGKSWIPSGIYCAMPSAYKWHHLTEEFQRVNGKVKFVSITIDGVKHFINRSYAPKAARVNELNVAVQLDGNSTAADYSMWVDKINFKYW
jgi:hypothetical protein